jgi:hypothetical protein
MFTRTGRVRIVVEYRPTAFEMAVAYAVLLTAGGLYALLGWLT